MKVGWFLNSALNDQVYHLAQQWNPNTATAVGKGLMKKNMTDFLSPGLSKNPGISFSIFDDPPSVEQCTSENSDHQ
ncbi:unnamed protein product [Nezara viridula]|uniref:Uncharacterized protein n=1 Tax=Nezara viridula TaxID=85310 RepID=A0A9P0H2D3_NEZVI|nr:unnamed protein product [Nezara viridula]